MLQYGFDHFSAPLYLITIIIAPNQPIKKENSVKKLISSQRLK